MTDMFQLPVDAPSTSSSLVGFSQFGLKENPFPAAGIDSGVLYTRHMRDELRAVNRWLERVAHATARSESPAEAVPPLALFGALGAGKTHLLRYLERGIIEQNQGSRVLVKGLADEGVTRLVLANLFLRYLPCEGHGQEPGHGMVQLILRNAHSQSMSPDSLKSCLRQGSPIAAPLDALMRPGVDAEACLWFSRWLRREYTTPTQRMKLGLAGTIESEGQAVRAVADLLRVARFVGVLKVWFVMIDQLEELWREGVVTPSRRARLLTDLRFLIDQASEGAPVALLMAWNTTTAQGESGSDVSGQIQNDYHALWQRLGRPVDIPLLRRDDVWPFAAQYLSAADVLPDSGDQRRSLYDQLAASTEKVIQSLDNRRGRALRASASGYPPRAVLAAWRQQAEQLAYPPSA